jgi:hypothetical protein
MTPAQLIAELDRNATEYAFAMMPVAFAKSTIIISSHDPQRLQALTDAIALDGLPLGIIVMWPIDPPGMTAKCRSFPGAEKYHHVLDSVMWSVLDAIKRGVSAAKIGDYPIIDLCGDAMKKKTPEPQLIRSQDVGMSRESIRDAVATLAQRGFLRKTGEYGPNGMPIWEVVPDEELTPEMREYAAEARRLFKESQN